jgi:hypothetical protein
MKMSYLKKQDTFNSTKSNGNNNNQFIYNERASFGMEDDVSDVMEENIRESDIDVSEKNQKISII